MKPKILVFIDYYLPGNKAGGPIRSLSNLIDNLDSYYEFKIVTRDRDIGDNIGYDSIEKNVSYNMKIQSVEIPLTLKMKTKEIGYFKYYGQFGFAPQIIINSTADIEVDGQEKKKNFDIKDRVAELDFSLVLGIGWEYNISGTTNLVFGLSYQNGFIDMLKGSADGYNEVEKKATTNQIALNLGVLF